MKLQYRRRAVTASLAVAAAAVGLAVTAPAAHASPEDPTHGVVGSYTATQPGDIVVDSATHRGYITQYGGPTSSLSVVDTNTGKSGKPNLSFNLDVETRATPWARIDTPLNRPKFYFHITCDLAHITDG